MLAELDFELDFDLALDDDTPKYCHILCCHPHITLCGTYKERACGGYVVNNEGMLETTCSVCQKQCCLDCLKLIYYPCPRCK